VIEPDAAILQLHALEELTSSPGWQLLVERWREREAHADTTLHSASPLNQIEICAAQTTCRVLREVIDTPAKLIAECMSALREGDDNA